MYQAMEIEPELCGLLSYMASTSAARKDYRVRLTELAQYGWMPLAAALFGTVKWQPQWLHHNFLPVIGLRVHAKVPPFPLADQQLDEHCWACGTAKRTEGLQCRALVQAQLDFALPTAFAALGTWHTDVKGYTFDIVHSAQQMCTGTAASDSQALLDRPRKWAQWVFSLEELWQDDAPMQDRPLMVGRGMGSLIPSHQEGAWTREGPKVVE